MRVKSPLYSVDVRGRFGPGVVFAKWRGTNWARRMLKTPTRRTLKAQLIKGFLSEGAYAWETLTDQQREDWNTYALGITRYDVFGNPYHVSGQNEFICNFSLTKQCDVPPPVEAPTDPAPGYVQGLKVVVGMPHWNFGVTWDQPSNVDFVQIFLTPILSYGTMVSDQGLAVIHAIQTTEQKDWMGPFTGDGYKRQWKIRGLMSSGQWGPWTTGISPPSYP